MLRTASAATQEARDRASKALRRARGVAGLTQKALAGKAGIGASVIEKSESAGTYIIGPKSTGPVLRVLAEAGVPEHGLQELTSALNAVRARAQSTGVPEADAQNTLGASLSGSSAEARWVRVYGLAEREWRRLNTDDRKRLAAFLLTISGQICPSILITEPIRGMLVRNLSENDEDFRAWVRAHIDEGRSALAASLFAWLDPTLTPLVMQSRPHPSSLHTDGVVPDAVRGELGL